MIDPCAFIIVADDMIKETERLLKSCHSPDKHTYPWLCTAFFGRCAVSWAAVATLGTEGFDTEALILARTMIEDAITLRYIGLDPYERTLQSLADGNTLIADTMRVHEKVHSAQLPALLSFMEEHGLDMPHTAPRRRQVLPSVLDRAIAADLDGLYLSVYMIASVYVHARAIALDGFVNGDTWHEGVEITKPPDQYSGRAVMAACMAIVIMVREVYQTLGLRDSYLAGLIAKCDAAIHRSFGAGTQPLCPDHEKQ